MSYLVTDIETVPDRTMWEPEPDEPERITLKDGKPPTKGDLDFVDLVRKAIDEKRRVHRGDIEKAMDIASRGGGELTGALAMLKAIAAKLPGEKEPMAPPYAQRPIVIGALWMSRELEVKRFGCISASKYEYSPPSSDAPPEYDERSVLRQFSEWMNTNRPTIVDWNGRTFDVPVIALRCFRLGVPMAWYFEERDYRYRYSDAMHLDLMDVMTEHGSVSRSGFKLDAFAKSIGLPGKHGVDGSMVERMWLRGGISEIEGYCMSDVAQTAIVFARHLYVRGRATIEDYRQAVRSILEAAGGEPRLAEWRAMVDEKTLLLPEIPKETQ